jgi:serine/threonine-protein kinase
MLQAGDTLAGYRIEEVAGIGGMGIVYRAIQTSLDRPVALKVLSSTLVGNRTFRERFRREGRHAAALDHPNIIPVYEAGESNGLMFIAMRLVDGPSLADLIDRNEVSGREALRVVGAIASALDAAHEAGLVHRDVKPQNILLTKTRHPYLADFGITKGTDHGGLTHSGDFVGSLNYVAPEQIDGKEVTGVSDIYSLTAVLFHCLSGTYPYQRDSDAGLMHAHMTAPPPTLAERGIDGPRALEAAFQTGMAKAPEQRFATGAALMDAVRDILMPLGSGVLDAIPAFVSGPRDIAPPPEPKAKPTQPDKLSPATPAPPPVRPIPQPGSLTAADIKRTPVDEEQQPVAAPRVGKRMLAGVGAALVAAPLLGYGLGHGEPAASPVTARSAALTVLHDRSWSASRGAIEGLELDKAITLRRSDGIKLTAGRMTAYKAGFDPVPRALQARFSGKSAPVTVRLGSRLAARHAVGLRTGERLWVAFVPDTKGWVVVACEGPDADRPAACPAVASTLEVSGATAVPLGPDRGVAKQINAILGKVNDARKAARPELRAKSTRRRKNAARSAARVHATAAKALLALDLRPQEGPLVGKLAHHLQAQATNLENLATATAKRRVANYNNARAAIKRRDARVRAALKRLRTIGYKAG